MRARADQDQHVLDQPIHARALPLHRARGALMARRDYVAPDDLQAVATQTVAHRLIPVSGAGRGRVEQVRAMLESVALP